MKKRIGLLGGTFNPIHTGHLLLAESARDQFKLDKVLFIPTGNNPFKQSQEDISKEHRLNMVKLAIAAHPSFEVMTYEIEQSGLTYTIDTVNQVKEIYPNCELYFIAGADLMFEINLWKGANELLRTVNFITAFRPGYSHKKLETRINELKADYQASIFNLCTSEMDIASSDIRSRISKGQSIRYLLPEAVERYIFLHQLYVPKLQTEVKMKWNEIESDLKIKLTKKRFQHTLNVVEAARKLAKKYDCDVEKASIAAVLHDCAKCFSNDQLLDYAKRHHLEVDAVSLRDPQLLHGPVGAIVARELYGVTDPEIHAAICYHTTGRKDMTKLDKIIYLADFIEKGRNYPGVETARKKARDDLDAATIQALTNSICHVARMGALIHDQSICARNDLIIKETKKIKNESE